MDVEAHKEKGFWVYDKIGIRIKNPKQEIIVLDSAK